MENTCINCGISVPFYERGILTAQGKEELDSTILSYPMISESLYTYKVPYESFDQLLKMLDELSPVIKGGEWKAGISDFNQKARLIPFLDFKKRMDRREAVEFIQSGKLTSHFQPIIQLNDGQVYGYESLLRSGEEDKEISPGMLFQTANETGLHSLLDQRARETAIRCRKDKMERGMKSFINFLPSTIYNPEFCLQHTFKFVEKYDVDPQDLVFEVVETEKIVDINHLKKVFSVYRREGMKVALDDVGSGFATLEMLSQLKPDYVKVDRSYISYCDSSKENQEFLNSVSHIARQLGIKVLAEGIERQEELEYCKAIGFDLAQGFYIGRPTEDPKVPLLI